MKKYIDKMELYAKEKTISFMTMVLSISLILMFIGYLLGRFAYLLMAN
ncbi:hypothetical protein [Flavobacterium sp. 140616W15]|nr:hypothetical protein [Flavobacterium sp. 140616W15]